MSTRVELHLSYILHTRPCRDTSLLVDILTQDYGKMSLVAKGVRKAKKNQRSLLQPFAPILVSWQGKSSLKTLIDIEPAHLSNQSEDLLQSVLQNPQKELSSQTFSTSVLQGNRLYSAMYINELLTYVLPQDDPSDDIFPHYQWLLAQLSQAGIAIEPCLRCFELQLLETLGYGIDCGHDAEKGELLIADKNYRYVMSHGFVLAETFHDARLPLFSGNDLLQIHQRDFQEVSVLRAAKLLSRMAFQPLLRGRELKSRELFSHQVARQNNEYKQ